MEPQNNRLPANLNQAGQEELEIDLIELLYHFLSKWYLLMIGLLVGAGIAGAYTYYRITPKFTATAKLYMVSNSSDTIVDLSDFNIGNSLSSDYRELIRVRPILEEVIEEEELSYTYEQLRRMITISTISDTRILQISVTSTSPAEAMTVANALADKATEEIPVLMDTTKPNIAERAIVPTQKSSPSMKRNVAMGGLIGLLFVAAILTVLFLIDDTMSSAEEVQKKLGIMPLTIIPESEFPGSVSGSKSRRKKKRQRRKRK